MSSRASPMSRGGASDPSPGSGAAVAAAMRGVARRQRGPVRLASSGRRRACRTLSSPREGAPAGQHLVEHAAERPDVGALVDGLAARLLRRTCRPRCRGSCPTPRHRRRRQRRRQRDRSRRDEPSRLEAPWPGRSRAPSRCRPARTLMFAGLRSRWTMPCSCAASSASAICARDRQRFVERQRARARCDRASVGPRPAPSRAPCRSASRDPPRGRRSRAMFG